MSGTQGPTGPDDVADLSGSSTGGPATNRSASAELAARDAAARAKPRRSVGRRVAALLLLLVVVVGGTAFVTLISSLIWPGEVAVVAPLICEEPRPDAFVVRDSYATDDGTSIEFTLYCVSEDGDAVNEGWGRAWLLLWVLHTAIVLVLIALGVVRVRARRRRAARAA